MTNMMKAGAQLRNRAFKTNMSVAITYTRGANSVSLSATPGQTVFEVTEPDGAMVERQTRDFIFPAADLVIAGSVVLPEVGDVITETDGSTTYVHEVRAPASERCYKFGDDCRVTLRVHTQQTSTEDAG